MRLITIFILLALLMGGAIAAQTKINSSSQVDYTYGIHGLKNGSAAQDGVTYSQLQAVGGSAFSSDDMTVWTDLTNVYATWSNGTNAYTGTFGIHDTAAIQAGMNATFRRGKHLVILNNQNYSYNVSAKLLALPGVDIEGRGQPILKAKNSLNTYMLTNTPQSATTTVWLGGSLKGITFDANGANQSSINCPYYYGVKNWDMEDCNFINPYSFCFVGMGIAGYYASEDVTISGCIFNGSNQYTHANDVMDFGSIKGGTLKDNVFIGYASTYNLLGTAGASMRDCSYVNNVFVDCMLENEGITDTLIQGNQLYGSAVGIILKNGNLGGVQVPSHDVQIIGNTITATSDNLWGGLIVVNGHIDYVDPIERVTMIGNVLNSTSLSNQVGFYLYDVTDSSMSGNTAYLPGNTAYAVRAIGGVKRFSSSGNMFVSNNGSTSIGYVNLDYGGDTSTFWRLSGGEVYGFATGETGLPATIKKYGVIGLVDA